jgi:hypothetical protein
MPIIIPGRCKNQPRYPVRVDWTHPLTRNLIGAWLAIPGSEYGYDAIFGGPGQAIGTVTGYATMQSRTWKDRNTALVASKRPGEYTSTRLISRPPSNTTNVGITALAIGGLSSPATASRDLASLSAGNGFASIYVGATYSAGNVGYQVKSRQNSATITLDSASYNYVRDGQYGMVAGTCTSGTGNPENYLRLYIEGKYVSETACTDAVGFDQTADTLRIGASSSGSTVVLGLGWRRVLTEDELYELSVNPWQIFTPMQQRFYSFPAAIPSGVAAAISGNFAIAGQLQIR